MSNMTALYREAALFIPSYERNSPVAPSDIALYRNTVLFRWTDRGTPAVSTYVVNTYLVPTINSNNINPLWDLRGE